MNKKNLIYYCNEPNCNNIITYYTWKYGKGRCRSCSKKGSENGSFIDGRQSKKYYCVGCLKKGIKTEISYDNWRKGNKRCASCAKKGNKNPNFGKMGKEASNFIHGKSYEPYSLEFNNKLKAKIRKRDNFECQNCGMTEEEHLIVIGTNLQIHHIDYNKKNCNEENLTTLCKQCNIRANYNRRYWKTYFQNKLEVRNEIERKKS